MPRVSRRELFLGAIPADGAFAFGYGYIKR